MTHILFIDELERLNVKKDSSLMMALSFLAAGKKALLLFEKDFHMQNSDKINFRLWNFQGEFEDDGFYLKKFELTESVEMSIDSKCVIHMRIDPPYDMRYHRYLWMLDFLRKRTGAQVVNDPVGLMKHNDKIAALGQNNAIHTFIGAALGSFREFAARQKHNGFEELILKPLDLYSGIGVEKISLGDEGLEQRFMEKVKEYNGAIIAQPFIKAVYDGEYRAVFFDAQEVGSIIKVPKKGEYLTNIAQGASYEKVDLPAKVHDNCKKLAQELMKEGIRVIAFDILGEAITEVNITCPGLFVEVSYANNKNLATLYTELF